MPEPSEYETETDWMAACVPTRVDEGDEQDQAVAVCLSMWREREDKAVDTTTADETTTGATTETPVIEPDDTNALKAISRTDDVLRVGNYIVLFDGRDLEGIKPGTTEIEWTNPDGSHGEYFTKSTDLESPYTRSGRVLIDVEHGQAKRLYGKDAPGRDDVLGFVDWSTKRVDDRGVWVERALDMHNWYMQWVGTLIEEGVIGTSSEAVDGAVQKDQDGKIVRWPLRRDSLTLTPMEWRNKGENVVQALKALGLVPDDNEATPEPEPEPEAAPEADTSAAAVDVAKAKARLQRIKLSLLEVQ